jgi:hypothetical protein
MKNKRINKILNYDIGWVPIFQLGMIFSVVLDLKLHWFFSGLVSLIIGIITALMWKLVQIEHPKIKI